jgi:hypothetical protein
MLVMWQKVERALCREELSQPETRKDPSPHHRF